MARPTRPFDPGDPFDALARRQGLRVPSGPARRGPRKVYRPRTANEWLVDDAVRRSLRISGLADVIARSTTRALREKVFDPLLARVDGIPEYRFGGNPIQREVEAVVREGMEQVYGSLVSDFRQLADIESAWQARTIIRRAPVEIHLNRLSVAQVDAVATSKPFEGRLLRGYWSDLSKKTQRRVNVAISEGIVDGKTTPEIVRSLRGTRVNAFKDGVLQTTRRHAEALTRTWTQHVSQTARQNVIAENADVIGAWQFVATLDSRTTMTCMAHDGKVYENGKGEIHRPPLHWNCRSTTVPVLKGWEELGLVEPPPSTRASMDGEVAGTVDYESWLRSKPESFQNEVLGEPRAKLFRDGMPIEDMVTRTGRPLSLRELAAVDD